MRSGESVDLEPTCTGSTRLQTSLRPELFPRWVTENAVVATDPSLGEVTSMLRRVGAERAQLAQVLELLEAVVLLPISTIPLKADRVPRNFRTPSIMWRWRMRAISIR